MRLELASFGRRPTAFVATLPYHVAAPLVLDSIGGLPAPALVRAVQRETPNPGRSRGRAVRRASVPLRSPSSPWAGTRSRRVFLRTRTSTRP